MEKRRKEGFFQEVRYGRTKRSERRKRVKLKYLRLLNGDITLMSFIHKDFRVEVRV